MSKPPTAVIDCPPDTPAAVPVAMVRLEGPPDSLALMFERLATNPDVDVAKLERLIAMQERILARNAESAFHAAFVKMQLAIPVIDEKGRITDKHGAVQSRYAKDEDIQEVLKPILARHGFSLSFKTKWPDATTLIVVGILTHADGFARESEFRTVADTSGNKNAIQALGSAVSYGHRYTTKDLLNIQTRFQDNDGRTAGQATLPAPPEGYEAWMAALESLAEEGFDRLAAQFQLSPVPFRNYALACDRDRWTTCKVRARARSAGTDAA